MMKPEDQELTCTSVFETLIAARIREQSAEAEAIGAVFQFDLTGEGGGQWIVDLTEEGGRVARGKHPDAHVTIRMAAADFLDIARGDLVSGTAHLRGGIQVTGDPTLALWLEQVIGEPEASRRAAIKVAVEKKLAGRSS